MDNLPVGIYKNVNTTEMFVVVDIGLSTWAFPYAKYSDTLNNFRTLNWLSEKEVAKMVFGKYWMKNMKISSKESEKHQQIG